MFQHGSYAFFGEFRALGRPLPQMGGNFPRLVPRRQVLG